MVTSSAKNFSRFLTLLSTRKDRNGGGVLIATKANSFKSMREYVPDSEKLGGFCIELVCTEMTNFCNEKVLLCSIYWPDPDGASWKNLIFFLDRASETYENMVIGGDLNLTKISWDSLENTRGTKEVTFLGILNDHFLTQLNFISTHRDSVRSRNYERAGPCSRTRDAQSVFQSTLKSDPC